MPASKLTQSQNTNKPTQAVLSSYFSSSPTKSSPLRQGQRRQRGSTPEAQDAVGSDAIDLTLSDDDSDAALWRAVEGRPPAKKRKVGSPSRPSGSPKPRAAVQSARPVVHSQPQDISSSPMRQFCFDPSSSSASNIPTSRPSVSEVESRARARERAKHILLADNNVFSRRLEVSTSAEASGSREGAPSSDEGEDDEPEADEPSQGKSIDFEGFMAYIGKGKGKGKAKTKGTAAARRPATKKKAELGPSGKSYTPLELQVVKLKKKHAGTLLMFEVGYKDYFYGDDAQVAAKHLGIVCYPSRNFLRASIPVHRREVHLKKLLAQGLKVGIVEQTETAALKKAGDTRNEVFERKLTHLYTAATYVDSLDSPDTLSSGGRVPPLLCVVENPVGRDAEKVNVSMVSVCASTGDVVWDQFEDNAMRTELETRLVHLSPAELLLPEEGLSRSTEKVLSHFVIHGHNEFTPRLERFGATMNNSDAFTFVTEFYADKTRRSNARASDSFKSGELTAAVTAFPKGVVVALAHLVKYLSSFDVADALLETHFFARFAERTHMLLNGNTLTNLEIYRNETDFTKRGSLLWVLDHTTTKFGGRMLREWVGRPLTDKTALEARIDAVEEILSTHSPRLTVLRQLLRGLPDLARGLSRIQYGKCTPQELAMLLPAFRRVGTALDKTPENSPAFNSGILNGIINALPRVKVPVEGILEKVHLSMLKEGRKEKMWVDVESSAPEVDGLSVTVGVLESELMEELRNVRKQMRRPALQYTTVAGEEYLFEIKKAEWRDLPADWMVVSATKTLKRLRTPKMVNLLRQRAQALEALALAANAAYRSLLADISDSHYAVLRDAVQRLAVFDCLCSLAVVGVQEGYVRPEFVEGADTLVVEDGRHPMIEKLRDDPVMPNSVDMGDRRHKIITGPNMGGKSSVVRTVALCAIMAQIGSYVPAARMRMSALDGILIRMGASDDIARGRSTFMVELQETSSILQLATPRSLVVLDELGRGTSTFDGMAIAHAVLEHLITVKGCKTLFITHYPTVALELERRYPKEVQNMHMAYAEDTRLDGTREVTFLYKLSDGITQSSFGVECARLAGLDEPILRCAALKRDQMEKEVREKGRRNAARKALQLVDLALSETALPGESVLNRLKEMAEAQPSS
ncbi:MutS family DNA mismatch repair protein [Phanerochaete sordida]|uniref:DNA mismatch repair protein MSH3 n=1 Tax=Phanerochaete sordida TaxID=48140 RepID=A0A9P3GNU3_9APHY|nr:MutS family DNA mismatch repair protein [Phanerochaete sordida]